MDKSKENFIRMYFLMDYARDVLIELLEYFIKSKGMGFQEFLQIHAHDILHLCFNKILCCRCHGHVPVTRRTLNIHQLDQLLDKSGRKLPDHIQSFETSIPYCCSPVRSDISIKDLDLSRLKTLLVEFSTVCSETTKKAIEELITERNHLLHTVVDDISNDEFRRIVALIEGNLLTIADVYGKREEVTTNIKGVLERTISGLKESEEVFDGDDTYKCGKCGETLGDITEWLEHRLTHVKDSKTSEVDLDYIGEELKSEFDPVEALLNQQHMRDRLNSITTDLVLPEIGSSSISMSSTDKRNISSGVLWDEVDDTDNGDGRCDEGGVGEGDIHCTTHCHQAYILNTNTHSMVLFRMRGKVYRC